MKFPEVFVCAGLALLAMTNAGVVPLKAGLSLKDKLALDVPLKQQITDKTGEKSQTVKVAFLTTTTPETTTTNVTTTTTTTTVQPKQQRPKYVDATVFRHQFTTPATSTTSFPTVEFPSDVPFRGDFLPKEDSSPVVDSIAERLIFEKTNTSPPLEDYPVFDYEAHFRLMDDLSPFVGELGNLGDDRRAEGYISSFRPPGF